MTLESNLTSLAQAIGADMKAKADTSALTGRRPALGMWAPGFPAASAVTAHEASTGTRYAVVRAFRGAEGGDWLHDDQIVSAGTVLTPEEVAAYLR